MHSLSEQMSTLLYADKVMYGMKKCADERVHSTSFSLQALLPCRSHHPILPCVATDS